LFNSPCLPAFEPVDVYHFLPHKLLYTACVGHENSQAPASDANRFIYLGNYQIVGIWNHMNGLGWAMFGTSATSRMIGINNAVLFDKLSYSQLGLLLFFNGKRQQSSASDKPEYTNCNRN